MKLRELMTDSVIRIAPEENLNVAARLLEHYNIGALPVCGGDGRLCGLVTDRDIVTRCLASGRKPEMTAVKDVMTRHVVTLPPDAAVEDAARIMGKNQVRRLPVVENGKLCGMVSLGDLAMSPRTEGKAEKLLSRVSKNLSDRDECP